MPDINDLLKPVPVAFDYATFRYYLELDVLQDTAKFLEWTDINITLGGTTRETTVTGKILAGTNTVVFDAPLPFTMEDGTPLGAELESTYTFKVTMNNPFGRPNTELWTNVHPYFDEDIAVTVAGNAGILQANSKIVLMEAGVPATIPVDTEFSFTHSADYSLAGALPVGATEGVANLPASATDVDVSYTLVENNLPYRNVQHIYDSITDEVLLRMGYTLPTQVPASRIPEMMLLGRIEAWKAVVRNTVTDIDMEYNGVYLLRSRFHQNAVQQLGLAMEDYNRRYGFILTNYSSPEVRTYSGAVRSKW